MRRGQQIQTHCRYEFLNYDGGSLPENRTVQVVTSQFGKKKILPNISPKKSWVGSISGFIASVLTFFIAFKLDYLGGNYSLNDSLVFGFISGVFGQFGDFGESLIKRDVGVKDSGDILRGHGGILDRFDSLLFSFLIHF